MRCFTPVTPALKKPGHEDSLGFKVSLSCRVILVQKKFKRGPRMTQQVEVLIPDLNSIPLTHVVEGEIQFCKLSSDFDKCALACMI